MDSIKADSEWAWANSSANVTPLQETLDKLADITSSRAEFRMLVASQPLPDRKKSIEKSGGDGELESFEQLCKDFTAQVNPAIEAASKECQKLLNRHMAA
eukprot:304769-Pyramimonas_sp.AAC.1